MMPPQNIFILTPENIAMALLKGGFSLEDTVKVIDKVNFDKSKWDGSRIIN
jgi:hypothetical protein